MPIEAIAITKMTATGMSVSCSGVVMSVNGHLHLGAERDHREGHERRDHRDHRRDDEDQLVGRLGDDVLLQRQLHAVGEALQQAEGAVRLGPMRCCIRATTRRSHQMLNSVSSTRTTKISTALTMTSQTGSWPKALEARRSVSSGTSRLSSSGASDDGGDRDRASRPGPTQVAHRGARARSPGAQTVPSARSATPIGRSTRAERAGQRDQRRRRAAPSALSVAAPTRTTGLRAVRRIASSPSCIRPSSSSCFQEARTSVAARLGRGRPA